MGEKARGEMAKKAEADAESVESGGAAEVVEQVKDKAKQVDAAPVESEVSHDGKIPPWVAKRIEQAQRSAEKKLFDALGVESLDTATAKLARLRELEDSQLSEQERTQKLLEDLAPKAKRADVLEAKFAALIDSQFSQLPESVREAIDDVAGGNADKRMEIMTVMRAAGQLNAQSVSANVAPRTQQTPPNPAGAKTRFSEYEAITNPIQRQIFYSRHAQEIEASRPA